MQLQLPHQICEYIYRFLLRNLESIGFFGSVPSTRIWGFGAFNVAQDESEGTSWDLVVSLGKA